jgi:hypothetical protein
MTPSTPSENLLIEQGNNGRKNFVNPDNPNQVSRGRGYPTGIDNFAKATFESLLDMVILLMNDAVQSTEHTVSTWGWK